ncbi:hypothetical protein G7Y79_00044g080680 [Physcia stellaris]|nr:hypothetical protein G7Y79_00044g080680 [Physcia stellaris]
MFVMADQMKLYLFGDQTYDTQSDLKDLLEHKQNPILANFFAKAYDAIRIEIYTLPQEVRDELPRFTCFNDLIFREEGGKGCTPLEMAMTCVYQLGTFISQADSQDFCNNNVRVLGLCTGALVAAAVSCSHGMLDLLPMAIDAIIVAFRIGVIVMDVAQRVAPSDALDQSWSMTVAGLAAAEAAVNSFNGHTLKESGPFRDLKFQDIRIHGPYHAPHLYSHEDVDEVLGRLRSHNNVDASRHQVLALSSAGTSSEAGRFGTLLEASVADILLRPFCWSGILEELNACLQELSSKTLNITPIGTKADQLIYTALKQASPNRDLLSTRGNFRRSIHEDSGSSRHEKTKLAIIGMSGRFPAAKDNDAFWDLLYRGLDVHRPVPVLHWDIKTHVDPLESRKNTSATPYGCWLDDPAMFDARFFNISPREAPQIDPAQRLALMTAYEAVEQAGIISDATPSTRRDRVGVFYGVTSNDWMETNSAQDIDTYFIPGGNRAFIPGRINYCFKFSGPSFAVDTACSSSLASIHLACNSLWQGDIDTAIAGGTNILTNPDFTAGLDRGHFLSRTGNCKTFDDSADGYCRGEGIGTVIIKRLNDAIADSDPVLGVILSAYTNHSAESESITRPHVGAQREIFRKILHQGDINPYDVSYVEMHGTGTQVGDAGEMSSVLDIFAPPLESTKRVRRTDEPLYLGSAKANIGHGEAASGVSSLIKVLLMMQKSMIVPHCGIKTKINHRFPTDLKERNVNIALEPTPWERNSCPSKPRRAFVNNFSAAGGNSALLLEDAPLKGESSDEVDDPRSHHVVAVSAKNGVSLQGNLRSMLKYLNQNPGVSLGKLSYTTTARRLHHLHRVMFSGSSVEELWPQIEVALRDQAGVIRPKSAPKIIFAFTGQGAQYPGMGKTLFDNFSLFRNEIRRLEKIGNSLGLPSILPVIQSDDKDIDTFEPLVVQLASVCIQVALSKLWVSWNIVPTAVVGHSLGEYAALNSAGVLSDADTLYLVGKRAELLQRTCTRGTHAMLVVKGSIDEIAAVLGNNLYEIACINSPIETVLAGPNGNILALQEILNSAGNKSKIMKVPYAFHSSQVEPVLADFKKLVSGVTFSQARIPILCPLDGSIVDGKGSFSPEYLARHCREPVNMLKALLTARSNHLITDQTMTLEIGPHPAISGMVRSVLGPQIATLAPLQRGRPAFQTFSATLKSLYVAGAHIGWSRYHHDFQMSHQVISLPAYSWDLKEYWMQYVNDWSLRKGDGPLTIDDPLTLETTTIHNIVEEISDSQKTRIIVQADIARKDLSPLVQGHEVDGIPLCTPSVYADMALTLGTYLQKRYRPHQDNILVDVSDMTISKALILRAGAAQQLLQARVEVDWSTDAAAIQFMSFDKHQKLQEHSRCVVRFKDRNLTQELQKTLANVKHKMQTLRDGIATGVSARFNRPMVYRAIRPLARFHEDYRAINEIVLNSNTLEASSQISFENVKRDGTYHTHPAIIDSLTQSCGFTMNCNDGTDLDQEVFMNHGWGSFQIFESLNFDRKYTTYTHMVEGADKLWHGDVVIFDGEEVVAYFGQIAIQGVPRRVLKVILSIESGNKPQKQQPTHRNQAAPLKSDPIADATEVNAAISEPTHASKLAQALSIIAAESGLAPTDLNDDTFFGDVGVDSLMGLTVSARFKEELDVDLDFNALFYECPTVRDLRTFLGEPEASAAATSISNSSNSPRSGTTNITTPESDKDLVTPKVDFERVLRIISEESGVATEDFTVDTNFADTGIDSLLSLVIVSRLRDELDLDIREESVLMDYPTVADLKHSLLGDMTASSPAKSMIPTLTSETLEDLVNGSNTQMHSDSENAALAARKKSVDDYVQKYTAGFSIPLSSPSSSALNDNAKVVLVTGASGSLGSHLVDQIAQKPDVKTVICLNREKNTEPYLRQQKAMRDKGIRSFDKIRSKLLILQSNSTAPKLGLSGTDYEDLVNSVTHLIHNAWPMSAKRALPGFEPQLQIMRNLIDFARDVAMRHPESFKFSFQMVSSIGVVGHHEQRLPPSSSPNNAQKKHRTVVPESRVTIDSVLPNGYSEAKWCCERMLDATLHRHPTRFRTMAVRLGQIAGSKTSGYWNPMEHFSFVAKSSQKLGALPDTQGTLYWTPVEDVASALADLVLGEHTPWPVYHVDNPVGQPWREMNTVLAGALGVRELLPFAEWVQRVRKAPQRGNPAANLLEFLEGNYERMSCGGLVLDVSKTMEHSKTLRAVGPVSEAVVRKYIHVWKEIGFLE